MKFLVFDTETPNCRNDRISQIGLCVVENGRAGAPESYLVDPECDFDAFNVMLTGITPEMCAQEPCFAALWTKQIKKLFSGVTLVAHNAPFDMAVLAKCLAAYGIEWQERAAYVDTVLLARRAFPALPNHKLDTLAAHLGLELRHHDAGSDALACAAVLLESERRGLEIGRFVRTYDFASRRTLKEAAR